MSAATLLGSIGTLAVLPLLWSGLVALVRRAARGWRSDGLFGDAHEKGVLLIMLAPIALGVAFLLAPRDVTLAGIPPLLDLFEFAAPMGVADPSQANAASSAPDWIFIAAVMLTSAYVIGVLRFSAPLIAAHLQLRRWTATARAWPAMPDVYLSEHAPMPIAVAGRRVIFPRRLYKALSDDQVRLVVAHERRHHARGDVAYYALLAWFDVLLWFNPFTRAQIGRCRLAAELDCDAAVTAAAPQMRRAYAQTLLLVLKHTAGNALPCAPAVFSHRAFGDHRMRIVEIMNPDAGASKRAPWFAYAIALALAGPIGAAQLALAQSADTSLASAAASASPIFSRPPLSGRISSGFGERLDPFTHELRQHVGVDIVGGEGDPIVAPADGVVRRVLRSHESYGNMLEIDHGGGYVLRYAQLSAFDVEEGEHVRAGQIIARVGSSGRATGPHLHLEVWRDGVAWDPALVLNLSKRE